MERNEVCACENCDKTLQEAPVERVWSWVLGTGWSRRAAAAAVPCPAVPRGATGSALGDTAPASSSASHGDGSSTASSRLGLQRPQSQHGCQEGTGGPSHPILPARLSPGTNAARTVIRTWGTPPTSQVAPCTHCD